MENNQLVPFMAQTVTPEGLYLYGLGQAINNLTVKTDDGFISKGNGTDETILKLLKEVHKSAMEVIKETNNKNK